MKDKIFGLLKVLSTMSETVVVMLGIFLLSMLVLYLVVYLKIGTTKDVETIDIRNFVTTSRMAWLYISLFIIFVVGYIIKTCVVIYRVINKVKNTEGYLKNKLKVTFGIRK